jgi:glycosyltransferase involved in cell wall biosynthesis
MYLEFNLKLFIHLLFISTDCYVSIDLDTIIPNYFASVIRKKTRVYDAHELFTELKEIVTRPAIQKAWLRIERFAVPKFRHGYTVNEFIAAELKRRYGVEYGVVRNLPKLVKLETESKVDRIIIYQGAVNEGRSFETLIPAMKDVGAKLIICGDGNFFKQVVELVKSEGVEDKIELLGMVTPDELKKITPIARVAVMLFEGTGLNQYQSLANRFFDYIMAGVPQVCVDYPQYKILNEQYNVASLISDTRPATIASALNNLLDNDVYYNTLRNNCLMAREDLNWQNEERILLDFYKQLFR